MTREFASIEKIALLGLFLAVGIILAIFETYIPRPLPWAKPGLANVVTLVLIYLFGLKEAILVNCSRVVLVNFMTGGFAGPAFWLALTASLFSALTMFGFVRLAAKKTGPLGVSMAGAYMHILVQLLLAAVFIVGKLQIFRLLPFFMVPTFFSGILVGLFAILLLRQLQKRFHLKYALPAQS